MALLGTCLIWGMGFNWNKEGQALLGSRLAETYGDNRLSQLGPAGFLSLRFLLTTAVWAVVFPASLRGWTKSTTRGGVLGGGFLALGLLLQHYGLSYTSESLSAFLTSLVVVFTPIIGIVAFRERVTGWMWFAIGLATAGIAMMTLNRAEQGFDRGALLGLLCAVAFSAHIVVIDRFGKREDPRRFTLAQFVVAAAVFTAFTLACPGGGRLFDVDRLREALASGPLWGWLALVALVGTVVTFGAMFRFQPDTTPTRAALIYMTEPLFATVYAFLAAGTTITGAAAVGGVLILVGNTLAELRARRPAGRATQRDTAVEPIID